MVVQKFAARCYWGMHLQIARRLIWVQQWVANGGAVLLGNAVAHVARGRVMVGPKWPEAEMPIGY